MIRIYSFNHLYLPKTNGDFSWMYWYKYLYYPTYNRLDGLLVGVAIAALYQFLPRSWSSIFQYGNQLIISGLIVLTGAYFLCKDQMTFNASVFGFPLIAIGYGCMVAGAVSPTSFLYRSQSKITATIASLSYALYLTHKGVIHMSHRLLADQHLDANVMLVVSMVACVAFAYLLHLLIEKPFMRWRNKVLKPAIPGRRFQNEEAVSYKVNV